jgi:hypothetical protein
MKWRGFLSLILISWSLTGGASERYEFYNGVRMLGMGGAGVAVVSDETALFINPAGLGRLRDYYITVVDPEVEVSETAERIAGNDALRMNQPQEALDRCILDPDTHLKERMQLFPSIVVPNFGFGFFAKYEVNAEVDSDTDLFKYDYTNDYAAIFGFNFRIWDGIIKIGTNARIINRTEVRRDDLPTNSTALSLSGLAGEGIGVGSDAGIMLAAPIAWIPTIGAVYRDVGNTSYSVRDGMFLDTTLTPDHTPASLDVGFAVHPIHGNSFRSTWTVDYRDVMTADEEEAGSTTRRLHGGVEFNFGDAFFVRGGMNQGFWTAGLELAIINYQFQAAAYGEDIGTPDAPREDRRYVVKFSLRF